MFALQNKRDPNKGTKETGLPALINLLKRCYIWNPPHTIALCYRCLWSPTLTRTQTSNKLLLGPHPNRAPHTRAQTELKTHRAKTEMHTHTAQTELHTSTQTAPSVPNCRDTRRLRIRYLPCRHFFTVTEISPQFRETSKILTWEQLWRIIHVSEALLYFFSGAVNKCSPWSSESPRVLVSNCMLLVFLSCF